MKRWSSAWLGCMVASVAVSAEWMRQPGAFLAAGLGLLVVAAALAVRRSAALEPGGSASRVFGLIVLSVLALTAGVSSVTIGRVERSWQDVREGLVAGASRRLGGELDRAVDLVLDLTESGVGALALPAGAAFRRLDAAIADEPANGVVVFDGTGRPVAWAGVQRVAANPAGDAIEVVTTPFYRWLVARRQTTAGTAIGAVLLARAPDVPRAGAALAERFADRTGVSLEFEDPHTARSRGDLFDYVLRSRGAPADTLTSVRLVPPEQEVERSERVAGARRFASAVTLLVLLAAAAGAARSGLPSLMQGAVAAASLVFLARAPLKEAFGPGSIFWPATYFESILGPFSASAGNLILFGLITAMTGIALWHWGVRRTLAGRTAAVVGAVAAPYLLQDLARGVTPPTDGVPVALWLVWQLALVLAASSIVLLAAALVRGGETPRRAGVWPFASSGIALVAAVAGLWLWQPRGAWPEWYPYLWVPALLMAIRPMPFRAMLASIAVVAGSAAALLTWGATAEGRMALAARDAEGLGDRADPMAIALLDRLVFEMPLDSAPATPGDLYLLWRRSALGAQNYPASLGVWGPGPERQLSLDLAELDLPEATLREMAGEAMRTGLPVVRPVLRVPGLHAVAAIPLGDARVLTVGVGPRTRLLAPSRLATFLVGTGTDAEAPYEMALAPPVRAGLEATATVHWERLGWIVRGERVLDLPGGARHAHAVIDLRGPSAVLQRGVLVLAVDVAALLAMWLLIELLHGRSLPALRAWLPRASGSLRLRLTASLAVFFILPTIALAAWSYRRSEEEFRSARSLLLQRTLRDAAAVLAADTSRSPEMVLGDAARQVDVPLLLSRGGVITAASAPVLLNLGLVDRFVPAPAFLRLGFGDELEVSLPGPATAVPTLVGYRQLERADARTVAVLAAPEALADARLRRREADLGIAVLVASVIGFAAAIILSGLAARALAHPLQRLREAALAVGSGEEPGVEPRGIPVELEPIAVALTQAAADVEAGRRAQRVLAWGEMARQVAHEIKNPLTPIRLGIQHLLRLERERPADVGESLRGTGERILGEIDRLDAIARAFSRFALPSDEGLPPEPVDVSAVAADVVHLYRMGEGPIRWELDVVPEQHALARRDELVEVLVNLCENARDAGAARVEVSVRPAAGRRTVVEVSDDGRGIPSDVLPRIFEPRFSTTTSGSGLGLAIARKLVERWGGSITAAAGRPRGTVVTISLRAETG